MIRRQNTGFSRHGILTVVFYIKTRASPCKAHYVNGLQTLNTKSLNKMVPTTCHGQHNSGIVIIN